MNYGEHNIFIGTETILKGEGDSVQKIEYRYHNNGIPYKIVILG